MEEKSKLLEQTAKDAKEFFQPETGPTRTTVVVRSLPHPHLLVEMKAIASFSA